jgi:HTH-type transcriptional regulator, sugar sensing transcriptional regulator
MDNEGVQPLMELGLTALEAEVYVFLLRESPATGYRIAQALGKAAANTYKAIESLERKGAVLVEEGANRLCRAVPAEELLGHLERSFRSRREEASQALARLQAPPEDDRVYQLRSREQVFERCRTMLGRCQQVAVLDVFPQPLEELRPDVEALAARGAAVGLLVYRPVRLAGALVALNPSAENVLRRWAGQWMNLVVDGAEHLLAYLTEDGKEVHQAIWTSSAYLSWVYHSGVSAELMLAAFLRRLEEGSPAAALQEDHARFRQFMALEAPGYQKLARRFGKEERR